MAGPVVQRESPHPYIVVCGPLAVGKTTVALQLRRHLGCKLILENLKAISYFDAYQQDMARWGYHLATQFLLRAIHVQKAVGRAVRLGPVCQDWHVREHHEVYNRVMRHHGILSPEEYRLCGQLHAVLVECSIPPDLSIVLHADEGVLSDRLMKRRRHGESGPPPYLGELARSYVAFHNALDGRKLLVDTSAANLRGDSRFVRGLVNRVLASLQETAV